MKRDYKKPTMQVAALNVCSTMLTGSEENGINARVSGYSRSSDSDRDGFSQRK